MGAGEVTEWVAVGVAVPPAVAGIGMCTAA